ncbi:MAG: hypothetical protein BKP49_06100 [Treponema sp. CETP13]|nr:MAG: hypothetical protein BKP49_06100 [Treponema sp. CETP13]
MVRGGPGLGSIAPAQSDYFQSTRGGGHGDYHVLVLAPKSVQEAADLTYKAFELADKWRMPAMILADGLIGQMMESVELPPYYDPKSLIDKTDWQVGGMYKNHRKAHHVTSIILDPTLLEKKVFDRFERYKKIQHTEVLFEEKNCSDADVILVAYGSSARVCQGAQQMAIKAGLKVGLFRPITLWPFPSTELKKISKTGAIFLVVEMSMGQMIEDIRLSVHDTVPVISLPHTGGVVPNEDEVFARIQEILKGEKQ